jgi:hypothetical protein
MIEVILSSETPDLTRAARRNIPEDGNLHLCMNFLKKAVSNAVVMKESQKYLVTS